MSTEQNKALVQRGVAHFNRGDLEAYLELYAEDAVLHDFGIEPGVDNIRRFYQGFMAAFPDVEIITENLMAEGDLVAERITLRGTHQGVFQGIPPTGKSFVMGGITILRFEDGKCVERWTQGDFLGLLQQLGAIPAPEAPADPAALARAIYASFSNDDFDGVLDLATEDVEVVFVPTGQIFRGHDGFRDFMQGFKTAFPDVSLEVTHQVVSEDEVISEFVARGTHTGPLMTPGGAIPPTGRAAEWRVCEVWHVRNGKLARLVNYQDSATLMQQLGIIPAPEPA